MNLLKLFLALLAAISLSACCADLDEKKVRAELNKYLHVGDSREKAELVMKSHGISLSYDQYQQRYQSNITDKNSTFNPFDKSVIVYIYIDQSGLVSKIEVSNSYTFL